jgi:peptidoglycan-associated lipoprotein
MNKILIAVAMAALVAGCQTTSTTSAPQEDKSGTAATGTPTPGGASTSGTQGGNVAGRSTGMDPLKDPNSPLSKRSIYFEFDSFTVADQYKPTIEAHAKYMQQTRQARVTLQGHADERGSREYNIALGQKRADAVKRMMTLMGVPDSSIETVSFGKEKPRNPGHDEAAWAENRRVDIVYSGE